MAPQRFGLAALLLAFLGAPAPAAVKWIDVTAPRYGADGFDAKPDDAAFAKALRAGELRRGTGKDRHVAVTLYIPRGHYRLSRSLEIPKWLNVVGDGATGVLLDFRGLPAGGTAIRWGGPVDQGFPGEPVTVSGFSLRGPEDSVTQGSGTVGILVGSPGDGGSSKLCLAKLANLQITHFGTGIRLGGLNYMNKFEHLYLRENGLGLDKPNVKGEQDNGENIHFEFCVFGDNARHFILNPSMGGGYGMRFANCSFDYARATPEAEIGSAGMVVFDACHWETAQAGARDSALLLRIVYPLANLMFVNTEFKTTAGKYAGTPIQWHSGAGSEDMNLTFLNCNFDGYGSPLIYDAAPAFRATQPPAFAIASPRLTARPGLVFRMDRRMALPASDPEPPAAAAAGAAAPARKEASPRASFACIDDQGRLFAKPTPCR